MQWHILYYDNGYSILRHFKANSTFAKGETKRDY